LQNRYEVLLRDVIKRFVAPPFKFFGAMGIAIDRNVQHLVQYRTIEVSMIRSTDVTSFTDFRKRLRDHLDERKATSRPLFVTTNGETEAVVLSPAAFDALMDQVELAKSLKTLDRSMADIKAGRTRPAKAAIREIAAKLGVKLDR
jgi:PHD/YefM family antitoxin component YafN of YafNO toxin-antitoxin module